MKNFKRGISGLLALMLTVCTLFSVSPEKVYAANVSDLLFGTQYTFDGANEYEYYVTLKEPGEIAVNFIADSSDGRTCISVYDANGTRITERDNYYGSYKTKVDLKAGQYIIAFRKYSSWGNVAAGTMRATFTSAKETYPENEINTNDEMGVASELPSFSSKTIKGQFASNDTKDYYTFKVPQSKKYTIEFSSALYSVDLQVFNEALDYEMRQERMAAGKHKYVVALPAGTYYLALTNVNTASTGNYTLKISTSKLTSTSIKSAKSPAKGKAKVTWSKKSGVNGYQVQIATNTKFTKNKKTYTVTANNKTISKLTSKKKYYVRVRTYTTAVNGKKCYSAWSKVKSVKVK